jgi:O-antigen/teichoic acid export membrane protein
MPDATPQVPPVAARSLRQRMLHASGWILSSSLVSQALRLASSLVLTRLLVPQAFGLVAAVQTLYFALVMFSDLGVWQSVVNRQRAMDARFLGTAMSVQLLRGALLALVVLALALGIHVAAGRDAFTPGTVYADPRLPWMMSVFALSALLQGAESMHLATAQRDLRTGQLVRLELFRSWPAWRSPSPWR